MKEFLSKINWKVRIKNKAFWIAIVPAVLILIAQVLAIFGVSFDSTALWAKIEPVIGSIFGILVLLGVVVDPTTSGVTDSELALTYEEPRDNSEVEDLYFVAKGQLEADNMDESEVDNQFTGDTTTTNVEELPDEEEEIKTTKKSTKKKEAK